MAKRPYDLPPLSALIAFEAAARLVSFKDAARELNVTPAAISHQVKALEAELGCKLFQRHHRGVNLTESGAYLFVTLQRGFEGINDAVNQLRTRAQRASVTIGVTTAVSSLWLTPKLAEFWKRHGDISVAQIVSDSVDPSDECDLSITYGHMPKNTPYCRVLFKDRIMALGSPRFAAEAGIKSASDLARSSLVHFESSVTGWTDWQGWFRALGFSGPVRQSHRVNNYVIALQAARDDMGAVLGWTGLTKPYLDTNELVPLLPDSVEPDEDFFVQLHSPDSERAKLVFDWLLRSA